MSRRDSGHRITGPITKKRVLSGLFLLFLILLGIGLGLPLIQNDGPAERGTQTPTPNASPSQQTATPTPTPQSVDDGTPTPEATAGPDNQGEGETGPGELILGAIPSGSEDTPAEDPETPTPVPDGGLRLGDGTGEPRLVSINQAGYPGLNGQNRTAATNTREEAGHLSITEITYQSLERDLLEPEQESGDTTSDRGELQTNFEAAIAIEYPNGSVRYLVGGPKTKYSIATLAQRENFNSTLLPGGSTGDILVAWRIPRSANNTIQSDVLRFNVTFRLQGDTNS